MVEKITFTIVLKDLLSGGLGKLGARGNATYDKLTNKQREYNRVVDSGVGKVNGLSGAFSQLKGLVACYLSLQGLGKVFNWGAEMEQSRIAFQTLLQDVEKGNKLFKDVNYFANITPYTNTVLIRGAKTLLAFGVAGDNVMNSLKMLGSVATGNEERMDALTLAYAQTQAAGKLMGQDLLQYVNAGFNPLKVISEKTGKSLGQLRDEMQRGAISAEMVTWAFQQVTSEGGMFYNMIEKQSQTIAGKWSTLLGKIQFRLGGFVESNSKVFTGLIDKLIAGFERFATYLEKVFGWMERNKETVKLFGYVLLGVVSYYTLWTAAQWALNVAMAANPIGIVVVAIGALVGGIIWAWNKFEGFRKVVLGLWGVVKLVFSYWVMYLKALVWPITTLWNKLEGFRRFLKEGLWETVKTVFNWIADKVKNVFGMFWNLIKPVLKLLGIDTAYSEGAAQGIRTETPEESKAGGGLFSAFGADGTYAADDGTGGGAAGTGGAIQGMSGTGTTRNITITIGSLIERFEMHTANLKESTDKIQEEVKKVLLMAVNDVNLAAG